MFLLSSRLVLNSSGSICSELYSIRHRLIHHYAKVGKRECVGYGRNGDPHYFDAVVYPMPAIRWKELTPELCALREKEKGDWRCLSMDEKKCLYRASFWQTYAEFKAPTGIWKAVVGMGLIAVSISLFTYVFIYNTLYNTDCAKKMTEYYRLKSQLIRMIDLRVNPITGLASRWDYEKRKWK